MAATVESICERRSMIVAIGQRQRVKEQNDDNNGEDHCSDPKISAYPIALFGKSGCRVKSERTPSTAFQFAHTDAAGRRARDRFRLLGRGRSRGGRRRSGGGWSTVLQP